MRCPATASSRFVPCTCTPRTRTRCVAGHQRELVLQPHASGDQRAGDDRAKPLHRKRAIDRQPRAPRPSRAAGRHARAIATSAGRSSSSPAPVRADTAMHRRAVEKRSLDEIAHFQAHELDRLVVDQIGFREHDDALRRTCSSRQMSKCSRVCGMTDSSAATISITQSSPPTPASIVLTNRSWPGTSTKATVTPSIVGVGEARARW